MIRKSAALLLIGVLTGSAAACGAATSSLAPGLLGVSARDAYLEARTAAIGWDEDARLRYIAGEGITSEGLALRDAGVWRFYFGAPGRSRGLVVAVSPLELAQEERPLSSPPNYVIGDNDLEGTSWLDSSEALDEAREVRSGAGGTASMLLVPLRPARWIVGFGEGEPRRVEVDAVSGAVLRP